MYFENRKDAGQKLAKKLGTLQGKDGAILALPRGGVPVAYEVARELHWPLDTIVVRKLGVIFNPEFAFGAISEAGTIVMDKTIIQMTRMNEQEIEHIIRLERRELERRKETYQSGKFLPHRAYDSILIIDDGMATGATMEVAIEATRILYSPREIIVVVPVASSDAAHRIEQKADKFIALYTSDHFGSVGQYYRSFPQTTDDEVMSFLSAHNSSLDSI